jgi:hypothetical protein
MMQAQAGRALRPAHRVALALVATALAACSGSGPAPAPSEPPAARNAPAQPNALPDAYKHPPK